jgi:hypothetical protein
MLASFNGYREEEETDDELSPPVARIITPEMTISQSTANGHLKGCENGQQH